jgi:superfamily I DNA/RNA helicase
MLEKLTALLAAFNDGANKGFWRYQWRDRLGRWAEMGRGVLGKLRLKDGSIVSVRGVFVGGTENPGFGRVLVEGQIDKGIPDGIYYFASGNGETFEGLIPEEDLIRQGLLPKGGAAKKDIFGNPVGERLDKDIQDLDKIRRDDITDEDRKLATETPDERQKAIIAEERAKSPVAMLPAGSESDPEQLAKALEDAGVTPKTQTQDAPPPPSGDKFLPAPPPVPPTEDGNKFLPMPEPKAPAEPSKAQIPPTKGPDAVGDAYDQVKADDYDRPSGDGEFAEPVSIYVEDIGTELNKDDEYRDESLIHHTETSVEIEYSTEDGSSNNFWVHRNSRTGGYNLSIGNSRLSVKKNKDGTWTVTAWSQHSKGEGSETFGSEEEALAKVSSILTEKEGLPKGFDINKTMIDAGMKLRNFNRNPRIRKKRDRLQFDRSPEFQAHLDKGKVETPVAELPEAGTPNLPGLGEKTDYKPGDMVAIFDGKDAVVGEVVDGSGDTWKVSTPNGEQTIEASKMMPLEDAIKSMPELEGKSSAPEDGKGGDLFDDLDFFDEEPAKPEVVKPKKKEPKVSDEVPAGPPSEPIVPKKPDGSPSDAPSLPDDEIKKPTAGDIPEPEKPADEMPLDEAIEYVSKMSMDELDALAKPEDYLEDTKGIMPSQEQTRALNAITRANADVVIDALAGSGKTWTLTAAANALARLKPDARILVLAFGNKNAADARRKVPKQNATAMTTHALAIKKLTANQRAAMDPKKRWMVASSEDDIALALGFDDTPLPGGNLSAADAAHLIGKAVTYFCNSADTEIGEKHVARALSEIDGIEEGFQTPEKLVNWAKAYWADVSSDRKVAWDEKNKKAAGPKRVRITHDHYLKMWSLSNPDLRDVMINGKPVTHVFFDEAQDTNPTVAAVMKMNKGKVQQTFVGDPNQAIFGFRGAENFLNDAKGNADAIVDLTRTRRFGDGMTDPGNGFLNLEGARRRVKGVGSGGEILPEDFIPDGPNTALLVRTNYAGLDEIMKRQEEGQTVGCLSVFYEELEKAIYHLKWLGEDFGSRSKSPMTPDGRPAYSDDFVGISNFKQLMKRAERDPKSKAARWLDLYYEKGNGSTEPFEAVLQDLVIDRSDMGNADGSIVSDPGTEAIMWITKTGKELTYSVDDFGVVTFGDNGTGAMFEPVNGKKFYEHLKESGMRFNGANKTWSMQIMDDSERQDYLDRIANMIPERLSADSRTPDVIVSTAHRAKGLEWDNVIIGPDFPQPKENPTTGQIEFPSREEFRLAYVALTRAKKTMSVGSLAWGKDYEGREGLVKANVDLKRKPGKGMEAWDYHEGQMNERDEVSNAPRMGRKSYKDDYFDDEELEALDSGRSSGPKKEFTDSWSQQEVRSNKFTKSEGGVTWELTKNADGTVTLRSRNDSSIPTKKYDSIEAAEKDFKKQIEAGKKSSREELKRVVAPFDKDGKIAKMIDGGASAKDINDALNKSDDWEDAIDSGKVNISTLGRALNRVGASIPPKKRKPTPKKKPAKPGQETPPIQPAAKHVPAIPEGDAPLYKEQIDGETGRDDKGGDVGRLGLNSAQLASILEHVSPGKPRDIIATAMKLNKNCKVKPDGSVVWFRQTKEETSGPGFDAETGEGRVIRTELSFKEGKDNSFTVMLNVKDVTDGDDPKDEGQTFYHYSKHHSLGSLVGDPTGQSAGLERLLDQYFDRDLSVNPHPDPQDERLYGGVLGAIKKLRAGRFDRILADKGSDDSSFKLRTPEEHAAFILHGRNRRFNKSLQNWWTQGRKKRDSLYDAVESNDFSSVFNIMNNYLAGLPDTPEARKSAMNYLNASIKRKFPNLDTRQMTDLMSQVEAYVGGTLPKAGIDTSPHLDKNNVSIGNGSKVRWTNNNGQSVVGTVRFPLGRDTPNGGRHTYGDFVIVDFPTGKGEETFGVRLNSKNMEVVPEDTPETPYAEWVEKDSAKLARYEEAGYGFDSTTGEFYDKLTGRVVDTLDGNYGGPIPDTSGSKPRTSKAVTTPDAPKAARGLAAGDSVYDQSGQLLGKVKTARVGTSKSTGKEMVGVEFEDGTKKIFEADENVFTGVKTESAGAPATKVTKRGKRAAALGVGGSNGKKISKNAADPTNEDTSVPVKGRKDVRAVKPTDEANEILKQAKELGAEMRAESDELANQKMRDKGYDVPEGTSYLDLATVAQKDAVEAREAADQAEAAIDKFSESKSKAVAKDMAKVNATLAEMKAEGLVKRDGSIDKKKLAKLLIDAGYRPLGYKIEHTPDKGENSGTGFLSVAAYRILKGQDAPGAAKLRELVDAKDAAMKNNSAAQERRNRVWSDASMASGDAVLETLKKEGVEFDNVSYLEFEGRIRSQDANLPFRPEDEFLSARALQEAFDHMPRTWILGLADHLKKENKILYVKAGVRRGHFAPVAGGYEIHLSSGKKRADQTKVTDTALHELTHFVQRTNPNLRALEHAWLYNRGLMDAGTENETMSPFSNVPGYAKNERGFLIQGLAIPYQAKTYGRQNAKTPLNPNDTSSEVFTMAMQDLFTQAGLTSSPNGVKVIARDPKDKRKKRTFFGAFFDEKTGKWMRTIHWDEEANKRIEPKDVPIDDVVAVYGRDYKDGIDTEARDFAMGSLLVLNDWSAVTGTGPGLGVQPKKKSGKKD